MGLKWNRVLVLIMLVLSVLQASAQHDGYSYVQDMYEKTDLPGSGLDTKKIQKYSQKYNYRKNKKDQKESNDKAVFKHESHTEKSQSWLNKDWVQALMYALVLLILIVVIFYLFFKGNPEKQSNRINVTKKEFIADGISAEELQVADTDEMLENAMNSGNYKEAVRVQYLRILQILMHKNLINPSIEKTNYDYVQELSGKKYENDFLKLTVIFERIWYGNSDINAVFYKEIVPEFDAFFNQIRLS